VVFARRLPLTAIFTFSFLRGLCGGRGRRD
jgi:hypothetical protein